jgi:hypothetical protein
MPIRPNSAKYTVTFNCVYFGGNGSEALDQVQVAPGAINGFTRIQSQAPVTVGPYSPGYTFGALRQDWESVSIQEIIEGASQDYYLAFLIVIGGGGSGQPVIPNPVGILNRVPIPWDVGPVVPGRPVSNPGSEPFTFPIGEGDVTVLAVYWCSSEPNGPTTLGFYDALSQSLIFRNNKEVASSPQPNFVTVSSTLTGQEESSLSQVANEYGYLSASSDPHYPNLMTFNQSLLLNTPGGKVGYGFDCAFIILPGGFGGEFVPSATFLQPQDVCCVLGCYTES